MNEIEGVLKGFYRNRKKNYLEKERKKNFVLTRETYLGGGESSSRVSVDDLPSSDKITIKTVWV